MSRAGDRSFQMDSHNDFASGDESPVLEGTESRQKPEQYRPVSLTSHITCMKIYERVIKKEIMKHLTENEMFNKGQHGHNSHLTIYHTTKLQKVGLVTKPTSIKEWHTPDVGHTGGLSKFLLKPAGSNHQMPRVPASI